jgi:DUF438 domain-containing protein
MLILLPKGELESMLDQIDVALTFVSTERVILYRNEAAARRPSPGPRDVGLNIDSCHEESESPAVIDRILADFRNGRREPHFYIGSRLGGRELVNLAPIFKDDQFVGCLSVVHPLEPPAVSKSF